jgi:hypothetical protein
MAPVVRSKEKLVGMTGGLGECIFGIEGVLCIEKFRS